MINSMWTLQSLTPRKSVSLPFYFYLSACTVFKITCLIRDSLFLPLEGLLLPLQAAFNLTSLTSLLF